MEDIFNLPGRAIHPSFRTADESMLITPYMDKHPFEDLDLPNSVYHHPHDGHRFDNCSAHEVVKRFLKQVRESGGYDVDCYPPCMFNTPFAPVHLETANMEEKVRLFNLTNLALQKINSETGYNYMLERIVRAVKTPCFLVLLTFTAKYVGNPQEHTFRAIVHDALPGQQKEVLEWRAKPVDAVAAAAHIDGWYMWNGHDFVLTDLYMWNGKNYVIFSSPTAE